MDPNQPAQPATPTPPAASAPVQPAQPSEAKGLAIAALVVGIVAFLSGWAPIWGMIVGIVAVVLGIVALKKKQNKAMSIVGLVLGALGLISSLMFTLFLGALFSNPNVQNAANESANQSQSEMKSGAWSAEEANAAYEKVTNGMTKAQVQEVAGREPSSCTEVDSEVGTLETCTYGNLFTDDVTFSVSFQDGAVTSKAKSSS